MTVIVKKIGGSVAVVIPKAVARELELTDGTPLDLRTSATAIIMRKQRRRPRRKLGTIVAQIKPASYRRRARELPDERPAGKELW
jgi:antitoxin component of MazEF toxin-antitoxin module